MSLNNVQFVPANYLPLLAKEEDKYRVKVIPGSKDKTLMIQLADGNHIQVPTPSGSGVVLLNGGEAVLDANGLLVEWTPTKKPRQAVSTGKSSPLTPSVGAFKLK